jgi:hypothetical protein
VPPGRIASTSAKWDIAPGKLALLYDLERVVQLLRKPANPTRFTPTERIRFGGSHSGPGRSGAEKGEPRRSAALAIAQKRLPGSGLTPEQKAVPAASAPTGRSRPAPERRRTPRHARRIPARPNQQESARSRQGQSTTRANSATPDQTLAENQKREVAGFVPHGCGRGVPSRMFGLMFEVGLALLFVVAIFVAVISAFRSLRSRSS